MGQACGAVRPAAGSLTGSRRIISMREIGHTSVPCLPPCTPQLPYTTGGAQAAEGNQRQGSSCGCRLIVDELHTWKTVFPSMHYLDHFKALCLG